MADNDCILTDEEIMSFAKAINGNNVNWGAVKVNDFCMGLTTYLWDLMFINENTGGLKIHIIYRKLKSELVGELKKYKAFYKENKNGKYKQSPDTWKLYMDITTSFRSSIVDVTRKNSKAIMLLNMWDSLYPTFTMFTKAFLKID